MRGGGDLSEYERLYLLSKGFCGKILFLKACRKNGRGKTRAGFPPSRFCRVKQSFGMPHNILVCDREIIYAVLRTVSPAPVRVAVCAEVLYKESVPPAGTFKRTVLLAAWLFPAVLPRVIVSPLTGEPLR